MKTLDLRWNRWRRQWELAKAPEPEKPQKPRTDWFAVLLGFLCGWMMFVVVLAPIAAMAAPRDTGRDLEIIQNDLFGLCVGDWQDADLRSRLCDEDLQERMAMALQKMRGATHLDLKPAPTVVRGAGVLNELLHVEMRLDRICRGSTMDDPEKREAICTHRDRLVMALIKRGYCYGMKGQTGADMRWHKCTRESVR